MNRKLTIALQVLLIAFFAFALTGCITAISAFGAGAYVTAEYIMTGAVTKTMNYEFGRIKKALLVALRKMDIPVDRAIAIQDGEEIIARADEIEIRIKLKEITPSVTRIRVKAETSFFNRDKATAQEIILQTNKIAGELAT